MNNSHTKKKICNIYFSFCFIMLFLARVFDAYKAFVVNNHYIYEVFTNFDLVAIGCICIFILIDFFYFKEHIKSPIAAPVTLICILIGIASLYHLADGFLTAKEGAWLIAALYFFALHKYKKDITNFKLICWLIIIYSIVVFVIPSLYVIKTGLNLSYSNDTCSFLFGLTYDYRLGLYYLQPNQIASATVSFFIIIGLIGSSQKNTWCIPFYVFIIALYLGIISLANSRTSTIASLLIIALFSLDICIHRPSQKQKIIFSIGGIIIFLLVISFLGQTRSFLLARYNNAQSTAASFVDDQLYSTQNNPDTTDSELRFTQLDDSTFNNRTTIWKDAIELIGKNPLLGEGIDGMKRDHSTTALEYYEGNAHNSILQLGLQFGLLPMISSVALVAIVVLKALKQLSRHNQTTRFATYSIIVILMVAMMENHPVILSDISITFFFLIGIIQSYVFPTHDECEKARYAINGRSYGRKLTGQERFCIEIVNFMDKKVTAGDFVLVIPHNTKNAPELSRIPIIKTKESCFVLWDQLSYQWHCYVYDLIPISFTPIFPLLIKGYVTIHDTCYNTEKQYFKSLRGMASRYYHLFFQFVAMHHSYCVFTVSDFSNSELTKIYKSSKVPVVTTTSGWEHVKRLNPSLEIIKDKFRLAPYSFYFSMSSNAANKNFGWVIETAKLNPQVEFIVSGKNVTQLASSTTPDNIKFLGYVSDNEMASLMKYCKAFIFPSTYEGFGLPPLETIYFGRPIIISTIPCLKEIYGSVAIFIDPSKPAQDIYQLTEDLDLEAAKNVLRCHSFEMGANIILNTIGVGKK